MIWERSASPLSRRGGDRSDVARAADHGDGQRPGGRAFKLRVAFLVRHRGPKLLPSRASIPPSAPALWRNRHAERSEEHTSELQSRLHLVCRLLLVQKT